MEPGILSQVPAELRPLATIFRPESSNTPFSGTLELQQLTGFGAGELVVFYPRRLALHELLVRVSADFSVPDGSRIEDLGINFREIVRLLSARYIEPQMPALVAACAQLRRRLADTLDANLSDLMPAAAGDKRSRLTPRWGLQEIAACERRAAAGAGHSPTYTFLAHKSLARVLITAQGGQIEVFKARYGDGRKLSAPQLCAEIGLSPSTVLGV